MAKLVKAKEQPLNIHKFARLDDRFNVILCHTEMAGGGFPVNTDDITNALLDEKGVTHVYFEHSKGHSGLMPLAEVRKLLDDGRSERNSKIGIGTYRMIEKAEITPYNSEAKANGAGTIPVSEMLVKIGCNGKSHNPTIRTLVSYSEKSGEPLMFQGLKVVQ